MGYQDFISEVEAAELAGVTTGTLLRFVEAGYLKVDTDSDDGLRLFSRSELEGLFGITQPIRTSGSAALKVEPSFVEPDISPEENKADDDKVEATQRENVVQMPTAASESKQDFQKSDAFHELDREIIKLKNVTRLQEQILEMKDAELLDLRRQREWLEKRIERLEEKSERDQLLILTEAQMVRQLTQRRSVVAGLLEWVGISGKDSSHAGSTIEVSSKEKN